jgi:PAS domain S-box-containing protein
LNNSQKNTKQDSGEPKATYASLVESLRTSEARYRELFEHANDLVFTVDLDGKFTSMNQTAEEITGFSRSELLGADLSVLVPPKYVDKVREMMRHKLATHERTRYEIEILAKDGGIVPVEIGSRLIYENDVAVEIQGIARDISERKAAEDKLARTIAELERSNQELEQFVGVASHDMHAPLRRIAGFGRLLQQRKSVLLDEQGREWIDFLVSSSEQMQQLIDDLLSHSRVGASTMAAERVDCDAVVREAMSNMADAIQASNAELRVGKLPTVMANHIALVQLFQNLIDNAIKYRSNSQPIVEVAAKRQRDVWRFHVKDNGIGIDPEYQQEIFEAFRRLHSDDEYEGTGIGLATCKKIVERLGGTISVVSEPGNGAEFSFTLPAEQSRAKSHKE